jgi:polar amino acid transport system permease protein
MTVRQKEQKFKVSLNTQKLKEKRLRTKKYLIGVAVIITILITVIVVSFLLCSSGDWQNIDYCKVIGFWDRFLAGFLTTLWLYVWSLLFGFIIGLSIALLRQYGGSIFSRVATAYVEIIRGTPLIAQLFFIFYGLNIPIENWNLLTRFRILDREIVFVFLNHRILFGIIALSLNSGAYQAEYLRGSMMSVGTGQLMAAQSLGMSRLAGIRHVVLPQALRRVIPSWSNEAAYLPKYTVVVALIGATELFGQAKTIVSDTFISLTTYIIVAIIFLITIAIVSKGLDMIHKRTGIPGL